MSKINIAKVVLGGLIAGLVLNIGEFILNDFILRKQMEDFFRRMNVDPPGTNFIVMAVLLTFLLGIVLVWIYALIRPRLGAGPLTAVVAGLIGWFCVYFYSGMLNSMLFGFSGSLVLIAMVWGFVEYVIAAVAGAWLYRES
jgi:uncharacterized membrane protein